jgi:hypothetical protein
VFEIIKIRPALVADTALDIQEVFLLARTTNSSYLIHRNLPAVSKLIVDPPDW